jgi:hypothetical protein
MPQVNQQVIQLERQNIKDRYRPLDLSREAFEEYARRKMKYMGCKPHNVEVCSCCFIAYTFLQEHLYRLDSTNEYADAKLSKKPFRHSPIVEAYDRSGSNPLFMWEMSDNGN